MIRIAIVDDHALFRESIARLLASHPGMQVVGLCGDLKAVAALCAAHAVDVLLLDYDLGAELGTDLLPLLPSCAHPPRVLMVSGGMSPAACRRSMQAGACGLVLKHSSAPLLIEAIVRVHGGDTWWSQVPQLGAVAAFKPGISFTPRQQRILSYILDGLSNKEIASHLDGSEASVKATIQELFRKTGVRSRSQLVRVVLETGTSREY